MSGDRWSGRLAWVTHTAARNRRLGAIWSRFHAWSYRRVDGRVVGRWFGAPLVVVQTVGRRTGKARETPVIALPEGSGFFVLAANAGNDRPPAWWLNLEAAGAGHVVTGGTRLAVRPRVAEGEERERLWARIVDAYPAAAHYPDYTDRPLPVVVLEPASGD
jgi:deazaflavin-dependent oxidoreductase (nitroreductase family)